MKKWLLSLCFYLIFSPGSALAEPSDPEITFMAGGDILFTPYLDPYIKKHSRDYPFLALKKLFKRSDIVFANLEVALTNQKKPFPAKGFNFKADPLWAKVLAKNGINLLSIANNHILDYGDEGLMDTICALRKEKLNFCGAGENLAQARAAALFEVKGIKVACLSYSVTLPKEFYAKENKPGTAFPYREFLEADVPAARPLADILIISFHWSGELLDFPRKYQTKLARKVIDLGADIVVGHHPHNLQGFEVYKNKLIAYSLGNLCFAMYSNQVKESMLLECKFDKKGNIKKAEIIPLTVDNKKIKFQPKPLSGRAAVKAICNLDLLSQPLGTEILQEGNIGIIPINQNLILPSQVESSQKTDPVIP